MCCLCGVLCCVVSCLRVVLLLLLLLFWCVLVCRCVDVSVFWYWCVMFWCFGILVCFGVLVCWCCVGVLVCWWCFVVFWCFGIVLCYIMLLSVRFKFQKQSICSKSPPRGNQVDGLPRATSTLKHQILFSLVLRTQWTDFHDFFLFEAAQDGEKNREMILLSYLFIFLVNFWVYHFFQNFNVFSWFRKLP